MIFMMVVKASKHSETGIPPSKELREAMNKYNDELTEAGVRVMAKGLRPSANSVRFSFLKEGEKPVVTYGPFTEQKDLIAGFFLIDVESKEEAIKWAMKAPDPMGHGEGEIELHQLY